MIGFHLHNWQSRLTNSLRGCWQKLDVLSPATLLAPVSAVFATFEQALQKVDLTALLDELVALLDDLFAQSRGRHPRPYRGLNLPDLAANLLASLAPLLNCYPRRCWSTRSTNLWTSSTRSSPISAWSTVGAAQTLFDQVIALLNQVADDVLVAGLEQVRQVLVTALTAPILQLAGQLNSQIQEVTSFYVALNPAPLVTALDSPYQATTTAFATLDPADVPPELQGLFDQLGALVTP